uniref:Uncharacterized protein n=1 Tax=Spongospora subterranea TaxID=70186 RepID=A0A0H5QNM3_9EUKA|eukprot:CRZ03182.1 hypothetical protein [Spongospora subterranea]
MISNDHVRSGKAQKMVSKAKPDRGPNRVDWISWLSIDLMDEVDRIRHVGVKFLPIHNDWGPCFSPQFSIVLGRAQIGKLMLQPLSKWITLKSKPHIISQSLPKSV